MTSNWTWIAIVACLVGGWWLLFRRGHFAFGGFVLLAGVVMLTATPGTIGDVARAVFTGFPVGVKAWAQYVGDAV